MSELLPCPFCGGEAETLTAESMHGGYLFGIMCNDCRSRGDVYGTEAEAIAAWNKRVKRYPESLAQRMIADGYEYELFELRKECDKLNAMLGSGTCELAYGEDDEGYDGWYTRCGGWFAATREDGRIVRPLFCQLCGNKAVVK